jgi:hypothetical protein
MNNKGMYLGKFTYANGGLVRMENGGPDPTKPYMYLDTQNNLNSWVRPPENPNQFVDWNRYQPAAVTNEVVIQGGKKVSPEEAARAKEYYRQEALKTPEGQEEERRRLMQEFVDQQNANKSPLQASFGNLSLDNPATRDAASNYASYKMGQSSPLNAFDRLSTGRDTPATTDFYRPNEATYSFGIPAAAVMAPIVAEGAITAAPMIAEGFQTAKAAVKPGVDAWNATMNRKLLGDAGIFATEGQQILSNLATPANLLKGWGFYDLTNKYAPEAVENAQLYNETGDTKYLKDAAYNTGKGLLESFSHTGPIAHEVQALKKPISFIDDARKMVDTDKDIASTGVSSFKTFKNTMGYLKQQGGDISVPNLKRVKIKALPKNWKSQ